MGDLVVRRGLRRGARLGAATAAMVIAGALAAGCGGDDEDAPAGEGEAVAQATACELAPPEQVEALVGQPLESEGTLSPGENGDTCHYVISPDSLVLRISVERSGGQEALENLRSFEGAEEIPGLGDGATYTEIAGFPVVSVLEGETLVGVSVPDELGRDGAEQLALSIVERASQGE